jgi:hypothetical protein
VPPSTKVNAAAVRDLLGIARVLYRAAETDEQRAKLAEVARRCKLSLELAYLEPDTLGGKAAWSWAEQAAELLGSVVAEGLSLERGVGAAGERFRLKR